MRVKRHLDLDGAYRRRDELGAFRGMVWCCAIVVAITIGFCVTVAR